MPSPVSRFDVVSRRAFLQRSLVAGAALAAVPVLGACGQSDAEVFATDAGTSGAGTTDAGTTGGASGTAASTTTVGAETTVAAASDTTAAATGAGAAWPAGAELVVDFTFSPESGGRRIENPYVAVWIEDEAEALVQTVVLWMKTGKGLRWLPDLKRWYALDQERIDAGGEDLVDTISSATRAAGDYSVMWDGTDLDGGLVAQGTYHVCIEAAREHGPYELIRQAVTIGDQAFTTELAPDGELTAASVTFVV